MTEICKSISDFEIKDCHESFAFLPTEIINTNAIEQVTTPKGLLGSPLENVTRGRGRPVGTIKSPWRHREDGTYDNKPIQGNEYFRQYMNKYYQEHDSVKMACEFCNRQVSRHEMKRHQKTKICHESRSTNNISYKEHSKEKVKCPLCEREMIRKVLKRHQTSDICHKNRSTNNIS